MTKTEIKSYYTGLKSDARDAKTKKTLRILESRSLRVIRDLSGPQIKPSLKKQALREHKKLISITHSKTKSLPD